MNGGGHRGRARDKQTPVLSVEPYAGLDLTTWARRDLRSSNSRTSYSSFHRFLPHPHLRESIVVVQEGVLRTSRNRGQNCVCLFIFLRKRTLAFKLKMEWLRPEREGALLQVSSFLCSFIHSFISHFFNQALNSSRGPTTCQDPEVNRTQSLFLNPYLTPEGLLASTDKSSVLVFWFLCEHNALGVS